MFFVLPFFSLRADFAFVLMRCLIWHWGLPLCLASVRMSVVFKNWNDSLCTKIPYRIIPYFLEIPWAPFDGKKRENSRREHDWTAAVSGFCSKGSSNNSSFSWADLECSELKDPGKTYNPLFGCHMQRGFTIKVLINFYEYLSYVSKEFKVKIWLFSRFATCICGFRHWTPKKIIK